MADWGTSNNVAARLTYKTIGASSSPTTSQVTAWIEEGESILKATLTALGFPISYSNTSVIRYLGKLAEDYAEARTRMAWAAADGTGDNTDGQELLAKFEAQIVDMLDRPDRYGQIFGSGTSPSTGVFMRTYAQDNSDNKSISAGDFDAKISKDEVF